MKNYEKLSESYYDKHAKKFDRSFDGFLSGFFKRYIVKQLEIKDDMTVLDVGAATGKLLKMLSKYHKFEGTGLDISSEMTRLARQTYPEFQFVTGSAMALPFSDASFDVVICSASFHHFPNPVLFLEVVQGILKPGGKLVIAEIRIPVFHGIYNWYIDTFSKEGDVIVYAVDELYGLLETAGFVLIKSRKRLQIQYFEAHKKQ
ncbi:methyltransferase domain-containing protein [Lactococcus piscium]|uniref:SAM-dependent methyltransferase n=1 Tax=Pseudolactococcus paracarnosus TaxID=2749962 RepID=A0A7L4WF37_9LACT|nr:methyltransferase domain-containing protein [Lactococcus paracarnosus]MCJ1994334.1 methyltransferase domain-containing protein [Lactococcus paracarnosus]QDJ28030.1 SAM-dependent methyltransferase [Lactococcus paracarnosus]SPC35599.1 SAM-dependent methyltransferase [Lactococcus piscium]